MVRTKQPQPPAIRWHKRSRVSRTPVSASRIRESHCGRYRVRESQFTVGPTRADIAEERKRGNEARAKYLKSQRLKNTIFAQWFDGSCWRILSRHKSAEAAIKACESHARKEVS